MNGWERHESVYYKQFDPYDEEDEEDLTNDDEEDSFIEP